MLQTWFRQHVAVRRISFERAPRRLFNSRVIEAFSHIPPGLPWVIYIPVVLYFESRAFVSAQSLVVFAERGAAVVVGLLVWILVEYLLHRFVFHWELSTHWGARLHELLHGIHHDEPWDQTRLVMPPALSIPLALLFYVFFRF